MKEGEKERERGEENGTDYIAKLLFVQAGVIFDYIGQRISCVGVQKRGGETGSAVHAGDIAPHGDGQLMFSAQ